MSRTVVVVTPGSRGPQSAPARVRVESGGPRGRAHVAARLLGVRGHTVRIALVAEGALLLAGDVVDLHLHIGDGCRLEVVEPAGTVAYDMRGGAASWRVAIDVATGGEVVWRGEPLVIAGGADVTRTLTVTLAGTATARLREILVLGRTREEGGRIRQSTAVTHDGGPVHLEDLSLDGARPRVGVLGDLRVVDTVSVLGRRAPGIPLPAGAHRLDLEAEATVVRALGAQTHLASLDTVWSALGVPQGLMPKTTLLHEDSHDTRHDSRHDTVAFDGADLPAETPPAGVGRRSGFAAPP